MSVFCTEVPSPLGTLYLAATEHGLCALHFPGEGERHLARLAQLCPGEAPVAGATPGLAQAAAELAEYFAGRRSAFTVPLDLRGTPFQRRVWTALTEIPYGCTESYAGVAGRMGGVARAVGGACGALPPGRSRGRRLRRLQRRPGAEAAAARP